MNDNWAAVLEAARRLPREQRRWIGHELLKTEVAVDRHGDAEDSMARALAKTDWGISDGLDCDAIINSFRQGVTTGEPSTHEPVFANHELFANL